jgi:hypothetical protein
MLGYYLLTFSGHVFTFHYRLVLEVCTGVQQYATLPIRTISRGVRVL